MRSKNYAFRLRCRVSRTELKQGWGWEGRLLPQPPVPPWSLAGAKPNLNHWWRGQVRSPRNSITGHRKSRHHQGNKSMQRNNGTIVFLWNPRNYWLFPWKHAWLLKTRFNPDQLHKEVNALSTTFQRCDTLICQDISTLKILVTVYCLKLCITQDKAFDLCYPILWHCSITQTLSLRWQRAANATSAIPADCWQPLPHTTEREH